MGNKKKLKKTMNEDIEDIDMNEIISSEDEYTETEKNLLKKVRTRRSSDNFDSDDEVYGLRNDDIDEDDDEQGADSMESDIEGLQEDYDLPDERAWGKKKREYYSTDYVDPDYASANQKDLVQAEIEEQEARNIQMRLAEQLDDADFGLEFIQVKEEEADLQEDNEQIVKTDFTKLTKRQKQALMQKESPEFMALVSDLKGRLSESRDVLAPLLKLVENDMCPECPAVSFVRTKYQLILNYCVNIAFYLMLKAKRLPVNSHPVIKRLAQYRQLLSQLEAGQGGLLDEIKEILNAAKEGTPLYNLSDGTKIDSIKPAREVMKSKSKVKSEKQIINESEDEDIANNEEKDLVNTVEDIHEKMSDIIENVEEEVKLEDEELNTFEPDGKRAITYQIAKNKGLTPHRKKEQRNPRVKHRNKYRKAKIRRKGAVREVRKELQRYGGEISGIKAGVKKSVKLK